MQRLAVAPPLRLVPSELIQKLKRDKMASGNGVKVPRFIELPLPVHAYL
ncbi:Uncharacterised protein [Chromobacterium violaceum]|uniref:Uncharacterized protein n=1 Tax=Chromobacterium violaceum TaxID=536 RepID=A0A3S5DLU2_CHRVL|nr:Uncharacterised protein [Chromobacterium violaceum]